MFYRIFHLLAALALRLFFRRIEVEGLDHVPQKGPVLLVCNHANSLVDPLLPLIVLRRRLTLTAKNVLGKNPLLAFLFWGLDAVPFHRAEDVAKGANPRENVRSMQKCREILARGGAVCIFPEGISHSDLQMRPFHHGAAKMALDFLRKETTADSLQIIPVGLLYTHKERFRSDAWLRFGTPIDAAAWLASRGKPDAEALTEDLRHQIESLVVSFQSRREMLLVTWASEIVATQGRMPRALGTADPPVAEAFARLTRLQSGYRELQSTHPAELAAAAERIRAYRARVKAHGVSLHEVYLPLHPFRAALFVVRELELMLVGLPLALFGILNHLLPYLLVRKIARLMSKDKDHWATNVIYPSFVIFPFFYLLQWTLAWLFLPPLWALLYALALPYTGYYALLYQERIGGVVRRVRTFFYFLFHRKAQAALAAECHEILQTIYTLAAQLQSPPTLPPLPKEHP